MNEIIKLKPLTTWEQMQKTRAKLPAPLRILTSLKTTAVLGATLGALVNPAAALGLVKGAGRFVIKRPLLSLVGVPTAYGVLKSSAKAREITKTALDPREAVKRGGTLGGIIEEPKRAKELLGISEDMTTKEKILTGLKAGGKVGAVIGGALAIKKGAPTIKKFLETRKAKKAEQLAGLKQIGFTEKRPVGLGGIPVATPVQISSTKGLQEPITRPPVQNIIQIAIK